MVPDAGLRILLVEDNPADARLMELALEASELPFETQRAGTLAAAFEATKSGVAAVVLDLGLPDSSGLETAKRFRAARPDMPVVVVTGNQDRELGVRALSLGVHEYITKDDLEPEVLERRLMMAMERARMQAAPSRVAGSLDAIEFSRGGLAKARANFLADRTEGTCVVASLNAGPEEVRTQLQMLDRPPASSFVIACAPSSSVGFGAQCLGEGHGWEDMAFAIERACRRMGPDVVVLVDSWRRMIELYGRSAAAELVQNLTYRLVVTGYHGAVFVEKGETLNMALPK